MNFCPKLQKNANRQEDNAEKNYLYAHKIMNDYDYRGFFYP